MELSEAYRLMDKILGEQIKELGFSKVKTEPEQLSYKSDKGLFRIGYDAKSNIMSLECSYEDRGEETSYETISKSLFELENADERDCRSFANEVSDEIHSLFASRKKVDLDKIKMPKAVSRSKAKNGVISYDADSLANRFGVLYPDLKNDIKQNISDYGEFLPETFFQEIGTPRVLDVIKNGSETDRKKLFKMLGEVYEDGTNEVQDIIGVTILGEMKNDPQMMEVADRYMTDYMAGPVHEINKVTAKKNRWTRKLANPPAYKPKKKKTNMLQNALNQQQR
ncbi:MAG TPA: hypothetical protein IAA41_02365 [Candidatus Eubacterium faecavium]|nr:hypothetical protein [Candidatus Eubacterium faecavium]